LKNQTGTAIVVAILASAWALFLVRGVWADTPSPAQSFSIALAETATPPSTPPATRPVTGSVLLKGGASATGSTAGSVLSIDAAFKANSPAEPVTEMRTAVRYGGGCLKENQIESVAWETFAPTKTFTVTVAINWIGFYVSAQFRDAQGNLSPVVCDDISVEGMPARPTTAARPTLAPQPTAAPPSRAPGLCGGGAALLVAGLVLAKRKT
jgi:hypothetical protein